MVSGQDDRAQDDRVIGTQPGKKPEPRRPRVGLFVTCLVDLLRPSIGFAAAKLIEASGCEVVVPPAQTCCGQPAYNSGDGASARRVAAPLLEAFADLDYCVAPSGSCAGMMKLHLPKLFAEDKQHAAAAQALADKTYELMDFLVRVRGMTQVDATCHATAVYHDSCAGLRELGVRDQPRTLLGAVTGLDLIEMSESDICCGFGGAFAAKFPDISTAMADKKLDQVDTAHDGNAPDLLLAGDLGCLLHMAGRLSRLGRKTRCRHVAEVLANAHDTPPIGEVSHEIVPPLPTRS